jgi:hypothetical protein
MFVERGRAMLPSRLMLAAMVSVALLGAFLAPRGSAQDASSSIGLRIGEKAPAFSARDQFDHNQSNDTLKGSKGTVLLFFRSADW